MSRGLAKAAIVIGAVAAIATGIGAVVGTGALLGIAGATFTTVGAVAGAAAAAAGVGSYLTRAKSGKDVGGGSQSKTTIESEAPIPILLGRLPCPP